MSPSPIPKTLALLAALALSPPSPAATVEPLSLEQALAGAQSRHEIPAIALARLERAQALRRQAISALLPSLTLTGTYTRRAREVTREIGDDEVTVQAIDAMQGQTVAETTLFDLRALPLLRAATHGVAAQERESDALRRALAFDVALGFLDVLSAERLREAADERVRVAEATLSQTRIRLEAGLANRNDATRTELELATARVVATEAASLTETTRLVLGFLIGEPVGARPLTLPAEPDLPAADAEVLVARALAARDEIAALEERARQAHDLTRVPRYSVLPRFDLRGLYRWTNEPGLSGREEDWNVAVGLTWELYDGGDRFALAAQRDAEAREAELELARSRREVDLEIRRALTELRSAEAAVAQAEVRRRVARANAEEVHERFANGLATALEEADALASRFEADAEAVRQGYSRASFRLDLLRALGDWPLPQAAQATASPSTAVSSEPSR